MTTVITFNTAEHTAVVINEHKTSTFSNITTIKSCGDAYYEMYQAQESGISAPIFRSPIKSTIIYYIHK